MAKKKLDKEMFSGVSGGALGQAADGTWEVLDNYGNNVFADRRTFHDFDTAEMIAREIGETVTVLTAEERLRRQTNETDELYD